MNITSIWKILDWQFSFDKKNEIDQHRNSMLKKINDKWDISANGDDLRVCISKQQTQNIDGTIIEHFFIHFDPRQSLINKLEVNYPEALI